MPSSRRNRCEDYESARARVGRRRRRHQAVCDPARRSGRESIDFLDITFRLEREFGIKIRQGELFSESVFRSDVEIVQDGRVTDEGLALLHASMPHVDLAVLKRDRRLNRIDDLFTVELLSNFIMWKLGSARAARL